jgi:hypothetical protein
MDFIFAYLLGIVIFALAGIICHELGHLVCGILTGYRFLSLRFFSLLWTMENSKIVLKRSDALKGVALGQCMLRPVDDFRDFSFVLYNLGGGLANVALLALAVLLCVLAQQSDVLFGFFWGGAIANAILALTNLIPMSAGGVPNDGKNIMLALRSEESSRAFWRMLKYNAEVMDGKRPRDFGEDDFSLPPDADTSNYLIAYIRILEADRLLDLERTEEAVAILQSLPLEQMPLYYRNSVLAELLFYHTAHTLDIDKANEIYGRKKMKGYLSRIRQPGIIRPLAAYQFFVLRDPAEGRKTLVDAKSVNEHFPYHGIANAEADRLTFLEKRFAEAEEAESA